MTVTIATAMIITVGNGVRVGGVVVSGDSVCIPVETYTENNKLTGIDKHNQNT